MVATSGAFFDTSVLLAGLIELGEVSEPAQTIMAAIAAGRVRRPHTAWHCCLEFYAVATRLPEEVRVAPADAWQLLQEEVLARFVIRQLPDDGYPPLLQGAADDRVVGGRIYDRHIAEAARVSRVPVVVTDNVRDFAVLRRHRIDVVRSAEFAAAIRGSS